MTEQEAEEDSIREGVPEPGMPALPVACQRLQPLPMKKASASEVPVTPAQDVTIVQLGLAAASRATHRDCKGHLPGSSFHT